jgi:hypothetical protein
VPCVESFVSFHELCTTADGSSIETHVANTSLLVHVYRVAASNFLDTTQYEAILRPSRVIKVRRALRMWMHESPDTGNTSICRTSNLGQPPRGDPLNWLLGESLVNTSNGMTANRNTKSSSGHQKS